jgi:arginyl-tRNA synthetase
LRKDGTTLYSSKDLALADIKFKKHDIDKSIYVVGNAQSLHMQQLFKTLNIMGFKQANKCYHLSFDEVRLPTGQMSSRTGQNILYMDMKENMFSHALKETKERHGEWADSRIKKSAFALAVSAMKFGMIDQDTNKKIIFDMEKAMDFEGDTGPYVQYAHARCCSIIKKAGIKPSANVNFGLLVKPEEKNLIIALGRFKGIVESSARDYKPFLVSRYALDIAHRFNEFYHTCQCISDNKELSNARMLLVDCTRQVLANSLYLLGISAPQEM